MATVHIPGPDDIRSVGVTRDPGVQADPRDFGAQVGDAVAGLGATVAAIGMKLREKRQQAEDRAFLDTYDLEVQRGARADYEDEQTKSPPGAAGFSSKVDLRLQKREAETLERLRKERGFNPSDEAVAAARSRATQVRSHYLVSAETWSHNERVRVLADQLDQNVAAIGSEVLQTGDVDGALSRIDESLEAQRGLIPAETLDKKRDAARKTTVDTAIEGLVAAGRTDEAKAIRDRYYGRVGSIVDRIVGVESGGRADARNPNSSATGAGQFIDSTWIEMVEKHRPDLAAGRSRSEILALRHDARLSRDMVAHYAEDNAGRLRAAGVPVNDGTVYLAHFAGPDGAIKLLQADPEASAFDVLGADVVKANPFLSGKSAGEVVAWAAGKMGVTDDDGPVMADPLKAVSWERRFEQQAVADRTAHQQYVAQQENDLKTRILAGEAGPAEIEAARQDWLTDADKVVEMHRFLEKAQEDVLAARRIQEGGPLNPYSAEDKKLADRAYAGMVQGKIDPMIALEAVYTQSGILPTSAVQGLRAAVVSPDPAVAHRGLQLASSIIAGNANAFAGYDGGESIAKQASAFQHFVERGMPAEDAARRVVEMNSPEYQAKVKAGDKELAAFRKTLDIADIEDAFELAPWLGTNAEVGFTFEQQNAILADFTELAEERFREVGDADMAKAWAKEEMNRVYGVTSFDGRRVFMKYPPEKKYPAIRSVRTGEPSHDYVYLQAAEAINAQLRSDMPELFVAGPTPQGLVEQGNIDINARPEVRNPDGSISTVRSMSFEENGVEVLVPTVSDDGRVLSDREAIDVYRRTGKHLGKFRDPAAATAYGEALHQQQAELFADGPVKPEDVILTYIPGITSRDWQANRPPRYRLSYWREENGQRVLEVEHRDFFADPAAAQKAFDETEPERRAEWDQAQRAVRAADVGMVGSFGGLARAGEAIDDFGRRSRRARTEGESDRFRREGN